MNRSVLTAICMTLAVSGAQAAEEWGIEHEKKARVDAKVVDLLCEVTGECADNCGNGTRQFGLLFDDGRLVPVVKNFDIFAGAHEDLKAMCGKRITADGLMISNPKMPLFALQFKREAPDGKWSRANWFIKEWSKANPGKPGKAWYKHDKRVLELIAKDGVYGIPGLKAAE
ncbi:MAG: hypothetical protein HKN11_00795 [Rhizobiales bacterium]|nr:hypothetical protein [Hyphomicrobiales bacterium]